MINSQLIRLFEQKSAHSIMGSNSLSVLNTNYDLVNMLQHKSRCFHFEFKLNISNFSTSSQTSLSCSQSVVSPVQKLRLFVSLELNDTVEVKVKKRRKTLTALMFLLLCYLDLTDCRGTGRQHCFPLIEKDITLSHVAKAPAEPSILSH